jgi:hypothetical protein
MSKIHLPDNALSRSDNNRLCSVVSGAMLTKRCECIDVRKGESRVKGNKLVPVFIMELHNEAIDMGIINFLQCNRTTNDSNYKVPANSDFAKLYRSTTGNNPTKLFSKASQLKDHFLGYWFIAEMELYQPPKGEKYLKVSHIRPEAPAQNDAWTLDGTLKKTRRKVKFAPLEVGDKQAINRRTAGEKEEKSRRQAGDIETLQVANSLGLESDFKPTNKLPIKGYVTNTQDHVMRGSPVSNQASRVIDYLQLDGETKSDYFDRVIDDSF